MPRSGSPADEGRAARHAALRIEPRAPTPPVQRGAGTSAPNALPGEGRAVGRSRRAHQTSVHVRGGFAGAARALRRHPRRARQSPVRVHGASLAPLVLFAATQARVSPVRRLQWLRALLRLRSRHSCGTGAVVRFPANESSAHPKRRCGSSLARRRLPLSDARAASRTHSRGPAQAGGRSGTPWPSDSRARAPLLQRSRAVLRTTKQWTIYCAPARPALG